MAKVIRTTRADSKGRVTLGSEAAGREFIVVPVDRGFRIDPVKTITVPEDEAWLWENPASLKMVLDGIEQSKAGKGVSLGDFSEFSTEDQTS